MPSRMSNSVWSIPPLFSLDKNTLNIEGKTVHLTAGMNVTAEIKTGKRRVLDYLLSPLQTKIDESFRER